MIPAREPEQHHMRTHFERTERQPLVLEIGPDRVVFETCTEVARTGSVLANIHEYLLLTPESRLIKLIIVAEQDQEYSRPVCKGWYVARFVSRAEDSKIRDSWNLLHEQAAQVA
jgi:hypothetical protein